MLIKFRKDNEIDILLKMKINKFLFKQNEYIEIDSQIYKIDKIIWKPFFKIDDSYVDYTATIIIS